MLDDHVELAEFLQPPGEHAFSILESHQPGQATVVSPNDKSASKEVMSIFSGEAYHSEKLLAGCAVVVLGWC